MDSPLLLVEMDPQCKLVPAVIAFVIDFNIWEWKAFPDRMSKSRSASRALRTEQGIVVDDNYVLASAAGNLIEVDRGELGS